MIEANLDPAWLTFDCFRRGLLAGRRLGVDMIRRLAVNAEKPSPEKNRTKLSERGKIGDLNQIVFHMPAMGVCGWIGWRRAAMIRSERRCRPLDTERRNIGN